MTANVVASAPRIAARSVSPVKEPRAAEVYLICHVVLSQRPEWRPRVGHVVGPRRTCVGRQRVAPVKGPPDGCRPKHVVGSGPSCPSRRGWS